MQRGGVSVREQHRECGSEGGRDKREGVRVR